MTLPRRDGRSEGELRPITIEPNWLRAALGSALITVGETRVLCAVTLEERVPPHLKDSGEGWVTGEYAMLPASGNVRTPRESVKGRPSGRTMEIQRLIGRCLRSVVDRVALGPRTLWVDCDVLQADGGTRTASITGAYVALALAVSKLRERRTIAAPVLTAQLAAVSVGMVEGRAVADLDYVEDASAEVDMNVVRTGDGRYVELQGTAETTPFRKDRLDALLALADDAIDRLLIVQRNVLGDALAKAVQKGELMPTVVVATGNPGKLREFALALASGGIDALGLEALSDRTEVEETGPTFEANARLKAEGYSRRTPHAVLADDSGLSVDALDGGPGIHSARYGGPILSDSARCRAILKALIDVPDDKRTARFRCVLAIAREGHALAIYDGVVEGTILREMRGENGFGYDPIFFHPASGKTFAELTREQKESVSHRGQAIRQLLAAVRSGTLTIPD